MHYPRRIIAALRNRLTLRARRGPVGIGLIGVGGWGLTNAVQIMQSRKFTIVGVHDLNEAIAGRFARRYGVRCFLQADELLAAPEVQAVCISAPNPFHAALVKKAADAHKHVFIEKPLASTPEGCRELGEYCRDRQVILQVGHQMRREPVFLEIKRLCDSRALGIPLFAQGVSTLNRPARDGWRADPKACPGGSMEQLGVHLIDALILLFGPYRAANGWTENIPPHLPGPDWGCISLAFDKAMHAVVSTSFSTSDRRWLEIFFTEGQLMTDGRSLWLRRGEAPVKKTIPRGMTGGVAQFVEFAECIVSGGAPATGAAEAQTVMEAIQTILPHKES